MFGHDTKHEVEKDCRSSKVILTLEGRVPTPRSKVKGRHYSDRVIEIMEEEVEVEEVEKEEEVEEVEEEEEEVEVEDGGPAPTLAPQRDRT